MEMELFSGRKWILSGGRCCQGPSIIHTINIFLALGKGAPPSRAIIQELLLWEQKEIQKCRETCRGNGTFALQDSCL